MTTSIIEGRRVEQFIPPEGVAINFTIASFGARIGAQFIDLIATYALIYLLGLLIIMSGILDWEAQIVLFMLLTFLLRIPYYILSELIWNGRTLGKRAVGIRVINVNGRRLTPHQITARNLMKEVEFFVPLTMLFGMQAMSTAEAVISVIWLLIIAIIPLANKRRQRFGDILAGTLVVDNPRAQLLPDLATMVPQTSKAKAEFDFIPAQLGIYGKFELQTLEEVLRNPASEARSTQIERIAQTIIGKIKYDVTVKKGEELAFLNAFYLAQREHLETLKLFGTERENKHHHTEKKA